MLWKINESLLLEKIVPNLLNFEHKNRHMKDTEGLLNDINTDRDLSRRLITGDGT